MERMEYTVKVTDPNHKYYGQELPGNCFYYDINHTGNSPDLFILEAPEGSIRILSTQIDEDHYWNQRRETHIKRLGANVGDTVRIIRSGSCKSKANFDWSKPHVITKIDCNGYVEWDGGEAQSFRPDVELLEEAKSQ
ncbi:hypothetical protein [Paenibacillus oleatilyticus]|uniref:Uncharacterized protein n=1 Tax=Paenibacillus oleatilyticus TaxID=2594886 RepID=A0ABV4UVG5_9BACL